MLPSVCLGARCRQARHPWLYAAASRGQLGGPASKPLWRARMVIHFRAGVGACVRAAQSSEAAPQTNWLRRPKAVSFAGRQSLNETGPDAIVVRANADVSSGEPEISDRLSFSDCRRD